MKKMFGKHKLLKVLLFGTISIIAISLIFQEYFVMVYYVNTYKIPKDLPEKRIRPVFRFVTGFDLPKNIEIICGVFQGTREPSIFVKYRTTPDNLDESLRPFIEFGVTKDETYDPNKMEQVKTAGYSFFLYVDNWEKFLGRELYDQEYINHARIIAHAKGERGYCIIVDKGRNIVYVLGTLG